jgi:phospholipid-binding lipoprotein MlaA
VLSFAVDPFGDNSSTVDTLGTINTAGGVIDGRAEALPLTDQLQTQADYYAALRDATAQQRADFVAQGKLGAVVQDHPQCQDGAAADE